MMDKAKVAELANGKDDVELAAIARKYGSLPLACDFDRVDITEEPHTSKQFTRENPFVHLAIREGHVTPDLEDISNLRKLDDGTSVSPSLGPDGAEMPIHRTVFKGE